MRLGTLRCREIGQEMEFFVIWFVFAIATAIVASSKGRSGFGWFILGCLFSLIALILVAVLPSQKASPRNPNAPTPETHVRCPDCRELVYKDARKCKHCGTPLVPILD